MSAAGLVAVILAITLAITFWPSGSVPSTIHGTITSSELSITAGIGGAKNCILNLPGEGSALDGVAVASAQLTKDGFHTKKFSGGEICWESFTFPNVPGNAATYTVIVNADNSFALGSYGCKGTIYFTRSRLETGKPIQLTCS